METSGIVQRRRPWEDSQFVNGGDMKRGPDSDSAVVWKFTPFSDFVLLSGKRTGKSVSEQNEV